MINLQSSDPGLPDVIAGNVIYRNSMTGVKRSPSPIGFAPQTITSIASADIDGDTLPDLVVGFKENPTTPLKRSGVKVFINPGGGDFSAVLPLLVGETDQETEAVTTVDINNDGRRAARPACTHPVSPCAHTHTFTHTCIHTYTPALTPGLNPTHPLTHSHIQTNTPAHP